MLLPNAGHAFVDRRKLTEYALDPDHPIGRHKAALFRHTLGFIKADAETLYDLLLDAAQTRDVTLGQRDDFGQRYILDFPVSTGSGSATVRSAWIVLQGEDFARLVTCFVL